jgi:hypothetical protein
MQLQMPTDHDSNEHPGAEYIEAAFGIQEQWRREAVDELKRQRGDRWWETPFEPGWEPPMKRGGRLMCERGHVSRDPVDSCRASVRAKDRKGKDAWRACGLPVQTEPQVMRCTKCACGFYMDGWCSSCGHRVGGRIGGDCWFCGVPQAMHWGPKFGHDWSATRPASADREGVEVDEEAGA